jgi:hypothetical protein
MNIVMLILYQQANYYPSTIKSKTNMSHHTAQKCRVTT